MKWLKIALFVLPLLSLGGGILGAWVLESGWLHGWESLGEPPGGAIEFVDANAIYVYVKNKTGKLYRNPGYTICENCWEPATSLEEPLIDPAKTCPGGNAAIPAPPGEAVRRLAGRECYADAVADFEYVILADGSVWEWVFFRGAYGLLIYPLFAVCGCLAGLVPLGIWGIVRLARRGKSSQVPV